MKGFTLVELVIVIVIVGILSIIGVREYQFQAEKAIASEAIANVRAIADANIHYYLEHGVWCNDINLLPITIEGKKYVYSGINRILTKNYMCAAVGSGGVEIAIVHRLPITTRYYICINKSDCLNDKDLYKIRAYAIYSNSTNIDKRIAEEINKKGRL